MDNRHIEHLCAKHIAQCMQGLAALKFKNLLSKIKKIVCLLRFINRNHITKITVLCIHIRQQGFFNIYNYFFRPLIGSLFLLPFPEPVSLDLQQRKRTKEPLHIEQSKCRKLTIETNIQMTLYSVQSFTFLRRTIEN
jgi:hypothetical protein